MKRLVLIILALSFIASYTMAQVHIYGVVETVYKGHADCGDDDYCKIDCTWVPSATGVLGECLNIGDPFESI